MNYATCIILMALAPAHGVFETAARSELKEFPLRITPTRWIAYLARALPHQGLGTLIMAGTKACHWQCLNQIAVTVSDVGQLPSLPIQTIDWRILD